MTSAAGSINAITEQRKPRLPLGVALLVAAVIIAIVALLLRNGGAPEPTPLDKLQLGYGPGDYAAALDATDERVAMGEEAVALAPQDWANQEALAWALLARSRLNGSFDDLARAEAAVARGMADAPQGSGPVLTHALVNMAAHRLAPIPQDLAIIAGFAVPEGPDNQSDVAALRGDHALYSGDYGAARRHYRAGAQLADSPGIAFRMAALDAKIGNTDAALAGFERAVRINPQRTPQFMANILMQIGTVEMNRGNWAQAAEHFAHADQMFPGHWAIEAHRAQLIAANGDPVAAAQHYRAIIAASGSPEAMDALALLYRSQGNASQSRIWSQRAKAIWAERLALLPEAAYAHAAEHELVLGDPARALALAGRNFAARPYGDAAILLAWTQIANGDPHGAIASLDAVERSGWRSPQQYAALAQAHAMLGNSAASDAARDKGLALNPRLFDPDASLIWFGQH